MCGNCGAGLQRQVEPHLAPGRTQGRSRTPAKSVGGASGRGPHSSTTRGHTWKEKPYVCVKCVDTDSTRIQPLSRTGAHTPRSLTCGKGMWAGLQSQVPSQQAPELALRAQAHRVQGLWGVSSASSPTSSDTRELSGGRSPWCGRGAARVQPEVKPRGTPEDTLEGEAIRVQGVWAGLLRHQSGLIRHCSTHTREQQVPVPVVRARLWTAPPPCSCTSGHTWKRTPICAQSAAKAFPTRNNLSSTR